MHERGITGRGINVAIIDQPLLLTHVEYKDRIKKYTDLDPDSLGPQMHGPAVASILCGKTCGVAPETNLYYWGEPSWKQDYKYRTQALDEIIAFNEGKAPNDRIRVVSISKGFDDTEPHLAQWQVKINEAEAKGIYIIHCSANVRGIGALLHKDRNDPKCYQLCAFSMPNPYTALQTQVFMPKGYLFVPIDNRTYAHWMGDDAYTFGYSGGLSWASPYVAGVVALGLQVNTDLTVPEIKTLLYQSGYSYRGGKIIQPERFVETVQNGKS